MLGEAQDDALVRVVQGDGLEAAEDEGVCCGLVVDQGRCRENEGKRTVADNDGNLLADGLFGDGGGQIVGEKDSGRDVAGSNVFLQQADVVPGTVGEFLGVAECCISCGLWIWTYGLWSCLQLPHSLDDSLREQRALN